MSEKTILTSVVVGSMNSVSDDEIEQVKDSYDADTLQEVVDQMEEQVESIVATRLFGVADEIPVLEVDVNVHESLDGDEAAAIVSE
jgi:hypothetical protein